MPEKNMTVGGSKFLHSRENIEDKEAVEGELQFLEAWYDRPTEEYKFLPKR